MLNIKEVAECIERTEDQSKSLSSSTKETALRDGAEILGIGFDVLSQWLKGRIKRRDNFPIAYGRNKSYFASFFCKRQKVYYMQPSE